MGTSSKPCGCKGCRTCLLCEEPNDINPPINKLGGTYVYCYFCNKAYSGWNAEQCQAHPHHDANHIDYPGIFIKLDFLTRREEEGIIKDIDNIPWDLSQSGRRKQNYGPKCNFKKRKLKLGEFNGFPSFSKFIQDKFSTIPLLEKFQTIEQCSLEYNPERGASIDPHVDDCWIWGERVVTVNLLSDSVLTMTYNSKMDHYNLDCVSTYPSVLTSSGIFNGDDSCYISHKFEADKMYPVIRIPMPRRSLLVMYGAPRYDWEHQVLREDIQSRRVCLAYREFTPPYLLGGNKFEESKIILEKAQNFI